MRITALSGGVGGARFLRGLLAELDSRRAQDPGTRDPGTQDPDTQDHRGEAAEHDVVVIGNTADDVTLHGLRVCPDLDSVMYTLGGGADDERGWGRAGETFAVAGELAAHGDPPDWFSLGDKDLATHVLRTRLLAEGVPLSAATARLCERWRPGVRLLPMTDDPVETHVVVDAADAPDRGGSVVSPLAGGLAGPGERALHFQEWWVRHHAVPPARRIAVAGARAARPGPGVLEALRDADVVLLPPSNPVVSLGAVLAVPGVREALRATRAPVVGVSPVVGGAPVRGMADACLRAVGVPTTAAAVAGLYADVLDAWLVDPADAPGRDDRALAGRSADDLRVRAEPLLMTTPADAARIAGAALDLAAELADLDVRPRSSSGSVPIAHAGLAA
ncbi:2-phospho-L-lactate transferase CofD family protein [uncultured Pseudokineococcus sp.]|uniref:2-phospho-L-lactate transferase CofD family protein n=1 Tax=uncultured Pseudokineococcus sp. TaxID=1642928 RepID=UPI0026135D81|nr:2-phospho-L-lactate transferase CofD family protein [uncultured Pseudokineococcus sp.]